MYGILFLIQKYYLVSPNFIFKCSAFMNLKVGGDRTLATVGEKNLLITSMCWSDSV